MYYITTNSTTKVGFLNGKFGEWTVSNGVTIPLFETWDDAYNSIKDLPGYMTYNWEIEEADWIW